MAARRTNPIGGAVMAGAPSPLPVPSSWLVDHLDLVPRTGLVLDVACGRGRHALFLASQGRRVHAIDRDADAIASLRDTAAARGLDLTAAIVDLETTPPPDLGRARYDTIVVFNYLHRPLFPALCAALAAGGRLFYETFTVDQAARGRPTNPAFLLHPGELKALVAPLSVLRYREGEIDGRCRASIVARRIA